MTPTREGAPTAAQHGPPHGYREDTIGGARLVAREREFDAVRIALATGSLHEWAARQPGARPLQGRGVAWATQLPSGATVVVRHSRHGGRLAWITRDLFLAPTRAPRELATAMRLVAGGVPTPDVVAYAVYGGAGPLRRSDVVTAHVDGIDFPSAWAATPGQAERDAMLDAVAALLRGLQAAGAWHQDLNVKNVLVSRAGGEMRAWVLDVDRVVFRAPGDREVALRNARRLARSVTKWRALEELDLGDEQLERLLGAAGVGAAAGAAP